jgi:hypothetical protein
LISVIGEALTARLRPHYYAAVEERVYISDDNDPGRSVMVPDAWIIHQAGQSTFSPSSATLEAPTALEVADPVEVTLIDDEIREAYLTIVDVSNRHVVTVMEVLSPTNKVRGARGYKSYWSKRREVLDSTSHLVEIDLLRQGAPLFAEGVVPRHDYLIHISRCRPKGSRRRSWVWPIQLRQRLPIIPIPLREGDNDAPLDLQQVLTAAYDRGGYDMRIDYSQEPVPPLNGELSQWARQYLTTK